MAIRKTVLIIGGSGFIGTHLSLRLREHYKIFLTYYKNQIKIPGTTALPLDFRNREWIKRMIFITHPDVLIYAAGSNDLFWAGENEREAEYVHSDGPAILAGSADIIQPKFIYLSNPYVFDGVAGNYRENETILPATQLGRVKTSGENTIRGKSLNHIILRTSPVLGPGNGLHMTFLDELRMSLSKGERVECTHNEVHSFTTIESLGEVIHRLIESGIRNKIMHFGGLTKLTHYDLAKLFAQRFGFDPKLVAVKSKVQTATTYDFSLNSSAAIEALKIQPLLLEESFNLIQKNLVT